MPRVLDGQGWVKATKADPCPICGKDSCIRSPDGEIAMCFRVEVGSYKMAESGGFLHRLVDQPSGEFSRHRDDPKPRTVTPPPDWTQRCIDAAKSVPQAPLMRFARSLGLSAASLRRQLVSYSQKHSAWVWPMWWVVGGRMRAVGVRLRGEDGRKWSAKGGRAGLFMTHDFMQRRMESGIVVICEGPTDAAAALGLGFNAIGLPSAGACIDQARVACEGLYPVIVADPDDVGVRSAERLRDAIGGVVVSPPNGRDLRACVGLDDQSEAMKVRVMIEAVGMMGVSA